MLIFIAIACWSLAMLCLTFRSFVRGEIVIPQKWGEPYRWSRKAEPVTFWVTIVVHGLFPLVMFLAFSYLAVRSALLRG